MTMCISIVYQIEIEKAEQTPICSALLLFDGRKNVNIKYPEFYNNEKILLGITEILNRIFTHSKVKRLYPQVAKTALSDTVRHSVHLPARWQ